MIPLSSFLSRAGCRRAAGFSLIEVTLALGIVTFALVGAIGVLPTALSASRQSFNKNRATAIAETLFASFRSEPFQAVCYLDEQCDANGNPLTSPKTPPLDLNSSTQPNASNVAGNEVTLYATILDSATAGDATDALSVQRHIRFAAGEAGGADYKVTMHFNNQPDGTVIVPQPNATSGGLPAVPAEANQVEMIIAPFATPQEQYHFVSIVANRTN